MTQDVIAECRDVTVAYGTGDTEVRALAGVDLAIQPGETVALRGRSGSGKTTLLHVLGGLVDPTSGTVSWQRGPRSHAFVFQGANLLPYFTAFENVAFSRLRVSEPSEDPRFAPLALLQLVGLGDKADALPAELSGGEAQRVALARALARQPRLLLCDEPTGQLDSDTSARILGLIEALQRELKFALVLATHDPEIAASLEREVELLDGRIVREEVRG